LACIHLSKVNNGNNMNTQRIYQLLISFGVLTTIAFISEKSRTLASVVSVMPVTVTLSMWFVFTDTGGNPALTSDFARMLVLGLIPTTLFAAACWLGFRQGWPLARVLVIGYGVWLAAMGVYRSIEWWLKTK
jgi:hypothetical protein